MGKRYKQLTNFYRQIHISDKLNAYAREVNKEIVDVYRETNHEPDKEHIVLRFRDKHREYIDITDLSLVQMTDKLKLYLLKKEYHR